MNPILYTLKWYSNILSMYSKLPYMRIVRLFIFQKKIYLHGLHAFFVSMYISVHKTSMHKTHMYKLSN